MEKKYEHPVQNIAAEIIKVTIKDISRKHEGETITILNLWRTDALKWIESDAEDNIFTFKSCCHLLEVEPKRVREMIKTRITNEGEER